MHIIVVGIIVLISVRVRVGVRRVRVRQSRPGQRLMHIGVLATDCTQAFDYIHTLYIHTRTDTVQPYTVHTHCTYILLYTHTVHTPLCVILTSYNLLC
jgi:hypothetical protein